MRPDDTGGVAADPTPTRPFRRRLLVNTAAAGLGNVWSMVVMVASVPLLLHALGTERFGTWVLLQTFSAITGWLSLADVGVGLAMTREVAGGLAVDDSDGARRGVGSGLAILVAVGVFAAVALATFGPLFLPELFRTPETLRDDLRSAIVIFAVAVFFELLLRGIGAALEGLQRIDLGRALDALRRTAVAVGTVAVARAGGGLTGVATATALATAGAAVVAAIVLQHELRAHRIPRPTVGVSTMRGLLRYGITVGALNATGVLHRTMDRLIAGSFFGPAGVALVEVATQLQNGAAAVLSASSYAAVSSSPWLKARGDADALRKLLLRGTRYSLLVSLPPTIVAAVLAEPLIRTWVGASFREASGLAVLALVGLALVSPLQVGQNLLQGVGEADRVLRAAFLAVVVNLVASIVLASRYGLAGVMWGTLIGVVVLVPRLSTAVLRAAATRPRAFLMEAVLPPALVAGVCGTSAAIVRETTSLGDVHTLVVGGAAAGLAFGAGTLAWGLHVSDRTALLRRLGR